MERLFNNKNKKILIGSSLQEIDLILKSYVQNEKNPISNYEKETIISLATDIVRESNNFSNFTFLDINEGNAVFYNFLNENNLIFNFIPKESFSYATSNDAYTAINQIRMGKVNLSNNDYKDMINKFEEYLKKEKYLDEPLIISEALEIMNKSDSVISNLGYGMNVLFFKFPSLKDRLSYLETEFLNKLSNIYNLTIEELKFKNEGKSIMQHKIPCYGYSNVIKYIANEIKQKEYNLNDVAIYASTNAYDNLIKGYFENYNINYYFEYGENALCEDFVQFFITVLDFLSNHFNINYLHSLYKNPALGFYDKDGKKYSYSYTGYLSNLKADKEQLIYQFNKLYNDGSKFGKIDLEKKNFILELVNIYNESYPIKEIYNEVYKFTCKYTNNLSHKYCKDALQEKERLFNLIKLDNLDFKSKIEFIKSIVSTIKITKDIKDDEVSYVKICSFNSTYLPRKHNFFIGLSAKELTINEIESPFISDSKFNNILDCSNYYVKFAKKRNDELYANLSKLLDTQIAGSQYFIASTYDSVEMKELSKSSFYINIDAKEENIYFNIEDINNLTVDINDNFLFPQTQENIKKLNNTNLSPSAISDIIQCPLKHIYSIIYEDIGDLDEYNDKWLKGGDEGTFGHLILENYFNKEKGTIFNNPIFEEAFNDAYKLFKETCPFSNSAIQDNTANKIKNMVLTYLQRYYQNYNSNTPYKPICCELDIKEDYNNFNYPGNCNFKLHGKIDRVDAYIDNNSELHIRLVDYKTSDEIKNSEFEKLTQVIIYPYLINHYINNNTYYINKLINDNKFIFIKKNNYDVIFQYEFLKKNNSNNYLNLTNEIEDQITNLLNDYYALIQQPTWKNFNDIYNPTIEKKQEHNEGRCQYCHYANYCRLKLEKGDNVVWKK